MTFENILVTNENGIGQITINRPSKLNALNVATINELHSAFEQLDANSEVRAIILTGEGEKAFVAGADISEFAHFSVEEGAQLAQQGQELLFDFVENLRTPVIAAVNGFALGGGLELAMSCHFRIASDNAKMGLPEVSLGVIPGYGGALRIGLVNHVKPQAELLDFATELASKILKNSPVAISQAIKAINANFKDGVDGYKIEIKSFGKCFGTNDFKEGTTAFLEKRKADFKGN